jgi:hypothetical protein
MRGCLKGLKVIERRDAGLALSYCESDVRKLLVNAFAKVLVPGIRMLDPDRRESLTNLSVNPPGLRRFHSNGRPATL